MLLAQIRTKFTKADTHMVLLKDVHGLGIMGEIVQASLGRARRSLVPQGLAYYVPRIRGQPILPEGWKAKVVVSASDVVQITPAFMSTEYVERTENEMQPFVQNTIDSGTNMHTKKLVESIKLQIQKVKINKDSERFYGSITPLEVAAILRDEHGLDIADEFIKFPEYLENKIRNIGEYTIDVALGLELAKLQITVTHTKV